MRVFVTGGHGFVGRWLCAHLDACGDDVVAPGHDVDVTDPMAIGNVMMATRPDAVCHLAGLAHVGESWNDPAEYFRVNALGTLLVLEAAQRCPSPPRVLVVSSAEVYGRVVPADLPVAEEAAVRPVSPYAASKAAAEVVATQAFLGRGLPVVVARPFNHAGPGQARSFVVPAIAERIVAAAGAEAGVLRVGNLEPRRDITDVRDVVRAYRLLIERGAAGEIYNVCSGRDVAVEEVVGQLLKLAGAEHLELVVDPELLRPADVPVLRGDPSKIGAATGWEPHLPLEDTLRDVLDDVTGSR